MRGDLWRKLLPIKPGEELLLGLLASLSFMKGATAVCFDTAANTLFVRLFGSSALPWIYLASAGVSLAVGMVYARLAARVEKGSLLRQTVVFLLIVAAGFALVYQWYPSPGVALGAMIWKEVFFILSNIVLWAVAGYLFDLRQGKRLFGLIASGAILAGIVGGLLVGRMVKGWGVESLFFAAVAALVGMALVLHHILQRYATQLQSGTEPTEALLAPVAGQKRPWWHLLQNRYLSLFLCLSILSNFGFFFADYLFFNRVESTGKTEHELADFFGLFSATLGAVQLVTSLFIAGPLITRLGLGAALLALPAFNCVGMALAAVVSYAWGLNQAFFWLIIGIKLLDEALRAAVLAPAFRILYQPLPTQERLAFQAKAESMIEPLGVGLAGGTLLLVTVFWPISLTHLCLLLWALLTLWIGVAELLRHEYTRMLTKALVKRRLGGTSVVLEDGSTTQVLIKGLHSTNGVEVLYCFSVLVEMEGTDWEGHLPALLQHGEAKVREVALRRIGQRRLEAHRAAVRHCWQSDAVASVRQTAVETGILLNPEEEQEEVFALLRAQDLALRRGAMIGLLRLGELEGVMTAGHVLQELLRSPEPLDRAEAALVLGQVGEKNFYRPLLPMLKDSAVVVRQAALASAAQLAHPKLLPALWELLKDKSVAEELSVALRSYGAALVPDIQRQLEEPSLASGLRAGLVRLLGHLPGSEATTVLVSRLLTSPLERRQILHVLGPRRYVAPRELWPRLQAVVQDALRANAEQAVARKQLAKHPEYALLVGALESEHQLAQMEVLALLALRPGAQALARLGPELRSTSAAQRARAVELLERLTPVELAHEVVGLMDVGVSEVPAVSTEKRGEEWVLYFAQGAGGRITRWTRACALYVMAQGDKGREGTGVWPHSVFEQASVDDDACVRETAQWAIQHHATVSSPSV